MTVVANMIPAEVTEATETLLVRNVQGSSKQFSFSSGDFKR
jgi:hypothetical protein